MIFRLLLKVLLFIVIPAVTANTESTAHTPDGRNSGDGEAIETVILAGREYPVPLPWRGNRLETPHFLFEDFRRIPERHCKNGGKIYVHHSIFSCLMEMLRAAEEDGVHLDIASGYRSIYSQRKIFSRMFAEGRTYEDVVRYVAPPGYSEHMLGTVVDFAPSNWRFARTPQYAWLKKNAGKYNFTESYARDNDLHMAWESWHWRCRP